MVRVIASWWSAHALEFVVWGVICAVIALAWFAESIASVIAERRKKKQDGLL